MGRGKTEWEPDRRKMKPAYLAANQEIRFVDDSRLERATIFFYKVIIDGSFSSGCVVVA